MRIDPERQAGPLALVGTAAVVGGLYFAAWPVAAAGCGLLLLACLSRADGFLLFGPFARADAVRAARRRRTHVVRALTVAAAGGFLLLTDVTFDPAADGTDPGPAARRVEQAHAEVIATYAVAAGLVVPLLTVMLVAGVIAEEKAAKRWDALVATDLRAREIVFGRLVGKLWLVVEPAVAVAPVLAVLPIVVNLSPDGLLLYAGALGVTMLALAGLTAGLAVGRTSRRAAGPLAGLYALLYLCGSSALLAVREWPEAWDWPRPAGVESPVVVADVVEAVNAANPFVTLVFHTGVRPTGGPPAETAAAALTQYAAGGLGVFLAGTLWACRGVRGRPDAAPRRRGLFPGTRRKLREALGRAWAAARPAVTDAPLAWWVECRVLPARSPAGPRVVGTWFGRAFALFAAVWALDAVGHLTVYPTDWFQDWVTTDARPLGQVVAAAAGVTVAVGLVLAVAVPVLTAAGAVAKERAGDTLDSLRLTPLTAREMMTQYRAGCLVVNRRGLALLAGPAAAAVATGFLPWQIAVAFLAVRVLTPPLVSVALYGSAWASTPARGVRNLLLLATVGHYAALIPAALAVGVMLSLFPVALGLPDLTAVIERTMTDPDVMMNPAAHPRQAALRTVGGDLLTVAVFAAGVGAYVLLGRWVFGRAVGRFARDRGAAG